MGKSEETVDLTYNQERERFLLHYKAVKKLNKDMQRFMELLRGNQFDILMFLLLMFVDLSHQQASISQDFYEMYETKAYLYAAVTNNQNVTKECETYRVRLVCKKQRDGWWWRSWWYRAGGWRLCKQVVQLLV